MAYSSGVAATPSALRTVIENFAVTNGYTLNAGAGSWLSKGNSNVMLTAYTPVPIAQILSSGTNTATVTASGNHNLLSGDLVTIIGNTDPLYNVTAASITVLTADTFTYGLASIPAVDAVAVPYIERFAFPNRNASTSLLTILGAGNSTGTSELCPLSRSIDIPNSLWPINYKLYYNSNPDQIVCVVQYNVVYVQVIIFEDLVKIHNSAYTGGNWFFATKGGCTSAFGLTIEYGLPNFTDSYILPGSNEYNAYGAIYPCIPFGIEGGASPFASKYGAQCFRGNIDGLEWANGNTTTLPILTYTDYTTSLIYRSPNSWNNQANLVPIHLSIKTPASDPYKHYLGYSEHLRLIRVDNYEIGDSITIGTDVWNVFPWHRKNAQQRNGEYSASLVGTGTLGFAVRKT